MGLLAFGLLTDPVFWAVFIVGACFPVSLWLLYAGHWPTGPSHLHALLALSPAEFEELVGALLAPLGYRDIRLVGGANDRGVDVLATDRDGKRVAIQCKRYQPDRNVTSSKVQTFLGGMVTYRADKGLIVTTSLFSAPARRLATERNIRLIDGAELIRLIDQHNLDI